jgi:hypothetical protein
MKKDLLEDLALEIGYQYAIFERNVLSLSAKTMLKVAKQKRVGSTWIDSQNALLGNLRKQLERQKKVADAIIRNMLIKSIVLNEYIAKGYGIDQLTGELKELQEKRTKSVKLSEPSMESLKRMLQINDATTKAAVQEGMKSHSASISMLAKDPRIIASFSLSETKEVDKIQKAIINNLQVRMNKGLPIIVENTSYKFKVWAERSVRTEMNRQSLKVLDHFGKQAGVVFYLCSYHQDCADDHAEYQGKVYVVEDWRQVANPAYLTQINQVIKEKNIKGFYWATEWKNGQQNGPGLTTRPNCRHILKPMPISEVVNKTEEQMLTEQRMKRGEYGKQKYEDMQKQRKNEREIRKIKMRIDEYTQQLENAKTIESKDLLRKKINSDKIKLSKWQLTQSQLVNSRQYLVRDKRRETVKIIVNDLGVRYNIEALETL